MTHIRLYGTLSLVHAGLGKLLEPLVVIGWLPLSWLKPYRRRFAGSKRLFRGRELSWSEQGFWFVSPMPLRVDLDKYYAESYSASITVEEGRSTISYRDEQQFNFIWPYLEKWDQQAPPLLVNFGAGRGAISNLFRAAGIEVVEVEKSRVPPESLEGGQEIQIIGDVSELPDQSVDVFFSSHSLEHVQDLQQFEVEVQRVLRPGALIFFEVPDCASPLNENGGCDGNLQPPHTYYFTANYFRQLPFELLSVGSYSDSMESRLLLSPEKHAVLRYLALSPMGEFRSGSLPIG